MHYNYIITNLQCQYPLTNLNIWKKRPIWRFALSEPVSLKPNTRPKACVLIDCRRKTLNKTPFLLRKVLPKVITPQAGPTTFGTTRRRTSTVSCTHYAASRSRRFATTCREPARTLVNPGGLTRSPPCGSIFRLRNRIVKTAQN